MPLYAATVWQVIYCSAEQDDTAPSARRARLVLHFRIRWIPSDVLFMSTCLRQSSNDVHITESPILAVGLNDAQYLPRDKDERRSGILNDGFCEWSSNAFIVLALICVEFAYRNVDLGNELSVEIYILDCVYTRMWECSRATPFAQMREFLYYYEFFLVTYFLHCTKAECTSDFSTENADVWKPMGLYCVHSLA